MPIPSPQPTETQKQFINRCMSDAALAKEFPDLEQRYAVCRTRWDIKK